MAAAAIASAAALALWIFTRTSAAYLMVVAAGNHIAGYAESSNGCLMFGGMIDGQAMNGVQNAFAVSAPLEAVDWRAPWFGQPFAGNLRAFAFAFQQEPSGFTLGLSIPYWFIIVLAIAGLTLPLYWRKGWSVLFKSKDRQAHDL